MQSVSYRTDNPYSPRPVSRAAGKTELDRPLRILIPSYRSHTYTGGQGVYLYYISRALVDMGHTVDIISGPPYPELDPRVGLIRLESLDLYAQPTNRIGIPNMPERARRNWVDFYEYVAHVSGAFPEPNTFGMRMVRYMRDKIDQYDVVHDNQTLCWGLLKLEKMGLPIVGTLHHPITRDRRISLDAADTLTLKLLIRRWYSFLNMQIKVARKLNPLIVVSESTKRDVVTDFGIPAESMALVYHGVDANVFRPMADIPREDDRLITTASADVPLKGLVYLIEAYADLLKDHPSLKLTVIGKLREGPTAKLLDRLGIRDKVEFISGISNEEIVRLYARSTIAVSPSVYEGFGFPAGEAMASGVPVVSTTGGSLPEVVGDAGVLVPPKDPGALRQAIDALLRDPERRAVLAQAGRERMLAKFRWDQTAAQVTAIYNSVIAKSGVPAHHADHQAQIAAA